MGNRQVDTFLENTERITKPSKQAMAVYREFFNETLQSPEYREAWAKVVATSFTADELKLILDASEHPGFKVFWSRFRVLDERLTEVRWSIEQRRMPELKKRLAEVDGKKKK